MAEAAAAALPPAIGRGGGASSASDRRSADCSGDSASSSDFELDARKTRDRSQLRSAAAITRSALRIRNGGGMSAAAAALRVKFCRPRACVRLCSKLQSLSSRHGRQPSRDASGNRVQWAAVFVDFDCDWARAQHFARFPRVTRKLRRRSIAAETESKLRLPAHAHIHAQTRAMNRAGYMSDRTADSVQQSVCACVCACVR